MIIVGEIMKNYKHTLFQSFGDKLYYYEKIDSTNNVAKGMEVWEHGTIIVATTQTAGRGTFGRTFYSSTGSGIYMSLVLDLKEWHFKQTQLTTIYTAVLVCDAIEAVTGISPDIKWVNDLFVNRRKIGGILTEMDTTSNKLIIGIGINLTGEKEDFPEEIKHIVDSLGLKSSVDKQAAAIVTKIYDTIIRPKTLVDEKTVLRRYKERLFILDEMIEVNQGGKTFQARVIDVNEAGYLIVSCDGKELSLSVGEVKIKV